MNYSESKQFAIDFEFFYDDNRNIVPLCVAMSDGEKTHCWWLLDNKQKDNFIATVMKWKDNGIFVAHAIEPAEGRCFYMLGLNPEEFNWRDTFIESVIVNNTNKITKPENSLVAVSKKYLKIDVDKDRKNYCRDLIITRNYAGHEEEIMEYCKSDVSDLLKIAAALLKEYQKKWKYGTSIFGKRGTFTPDFLLNIGNVSAMYATIGCRGIPLNDKYVRLLRENARECLADVQLEFNKQYNIYDVNKNKITRKTDRLQALLSDFITSKGIDWERTATGKLSTAEKVLKEWKGSGTFPDLLRTHGKTCRVLSSFTKDGERNWLNNYNGETKKICPSLFPYGTQTGRCAAKPKSGFIYTWGKQFRGLINPPEGYCLIEMDYGSQEVCISADWSKDQSMLDSYHQNDYYLAFMQKCGKFPKDLPLPTEEERSLDIYKPYKAIRQLSKGCCLGLSYGMGVKKLAGAMGCEEATAQEYKNSFEKVYKRYTIERQMLKKEVSKKDGCVLTFPDGFMYEVMPSGFDTRSINSILNLPIQGLGSVILRRLVKLCFERNLHLIATIHDAVVVMCKVEDKEKVAQELSKAMHDAADDILGTHDMKVGAPEYTFNNHPQAHGAEKEWEQLVNMLEAIEKQHVIPDTLDLFEDDFN